MQVEEEIEGILAQTSPHARSFTEVITPVVFICSAVTAKVLIKVQREPPSEPRGNHSRQHRMQTVAGPGIEVEVWTLDRPVVRDEHHIVGCEVVGPLVRLVEHLIVEIEVEAGKGIRNGRLQLKFVGIRHLGHKVFGNLNGRVIVLALRQSEGENQDRSRNQSAVSHKKRFLK